MKTKPSFFNAAILLIAVAAWSWIAVQLPASVPWWAFLSILSAGAALIGYWSQVPFPVRIEVGTPEPRLRYLPSVLLAMSWTVSWGACRWVRYACRRPGHFRPHNCRLAAFTWGRRSSPKAMLCEECGWAGSLRWMRHSYDSDGCGDVEPVERCPACGATDEHRPLLVRRNGAWGS